MAKRTISKSDEDSTTPTRRRKINGDAAAADMALRAAGVARLLGVELGPEVLEGLWRENAALALDLGDDLPLPRIALEGDSSRETRGPRSGTSRDP